MYAWLHGMHCIASWHAFHHGMHCIALHCIMACIRSLFTHNFQYQLTNSCFLARRTTRIVSGLASGNEETSGVPRNRKCMDLA